MTDQSKTWLISVATYKRPQELTQLLLSLTESLDRHPDEGVRADLVVVNNDAEVSDDIERIVNAHTAGFHATHYVLEPEPGIAAARNRGLEFFTTSHDAIVFVDDDEWVAPDWWGNLVDYSILTDADVVTGPVMTHLDSNAPGWIVKGGFYQRPVQTTGPGLRSAATNNTLLKRRAWLRAGSPRFDTSFSTTGGSDWDFFWGVRKAGATLHYCADVVVHEAVPPTRQSYRWMSRRAIRNGMVNTRVRRKHGDPVVRTLPRGFARLGYNVALQSGLLVTGRGLQFKPWNAVHHELGKMLGLAGVKTHEYSRDASSHTL